MFLLVPPQFDDLIELNAKTNVDTWTLTPALMDSDVSTESNRKMHPIYLDMEQNIRK